MTMQTRQQAIEGLVKAAEYALARDGDAYELEAEVADDLQSALAALAAYRAAPKLTREQVEKAIADLWPVRDHWPEGYGESEAKHITDAIWPLLEAAGAVELATTGPSL